MKKHLLVLISCFLTLGLCAQIANTPSDYVVCDYGFNDGLAEFDLSLKDAEILQGQNPVGFTVGYYLSQQDADNTINQLSSPFTNFTNPQTIFASVMENSTGNYDTTNFDLVVNPVPSFNQPTPLYSCDFDDDGFAEFDLTEATQEIIGSQTDLSVTYYVTQAEAEEGIT